MKRVIDRAPLALQVSRWMTRHKIPGGSGLLRLAEAQGYFDVIARYQLSGVAFHVPLFRKDNRWDRRDVREYESELLDAVVPALAPMTDVTLFDCGADIGTFSALVASRFRRLKRVVAFEPSSDSFGLLQMNIDALSIPAEAHRKAVSSFEGKGKLERPSYDSSDHARYLAPGDGDIDVITIDSFAAFGENIAIKIDVEGGEENVLRGAEQTIRSARSCVITLEAHPLVVRRLQRDPVESLRFLASIRPFRFIVAETGREVTPDRPLLAPDQKQIWNVVAESRAEDVNTNTAKRAA